MFHLQKKRPSNFYRILFIFLFSLSLFVTFYNRTFFQFGNFFLRRPENYIKVRLDFDSSANAKCQFHDNIIIYILSTITNFQRRKLIRSTWATPYPRTCFIFIVGRPSEQNSVQLMILKEKHQYHDIVQIDYNESYANVIYKELAVLHWSSNFYPFIPYLFKTDDDLIIDSILISDIAQILVTNLYNETSYINKYRPQLIKSLLGSDRRIFFRGGWSMDTQPTLRSTKFAISKDVWPKPVLPLYCSGFGWFMSKHIRDKLVQTSLTYPLNKVAWIGDVFISGFLAKAANVRCTGIAIDYEQTASGNCSCLMKQNPMLTVCSSTYHGGISTNETLTTLEYKKAWTVIERRHRFLMNYSDC